MSNVGEIIKQYRIKKGMTQEELGKEVFVSKQAVSKWENGRTLPDINTLRELSKILEIPSDELLGETVSEVERKNKLMRLLCGISVLVLVLVVAFLGVPLIKQAAYIKYIESGYGAGDENPANMNALNVELVELLADPGKYDGKFVRVIGVGVLLDFETNFLSVSRDNAEAFTNLVELELGDRAVSYEKAQQYNHEYVIVEGFFEKRTADIGEMGCGTIRNVSRYERWTIHLIDNVSIVHDMTSGTSSYTVRADDGRLLISDDDVRCEVDREIADEYVVGIRLKKGGGILDNEVTYCDVADGRVSETFRAVLAAQNDTVIYLLEENGERCIAARDIFNGEGYFETFELEKGAEIVGCELIGVGKLSVRYRADGEIKETTVYFGNK